MAKLESAIKEAIARGARKQVRAATLPLRREVLRLRRRMLDLVKAMSNVRRSAMGWERMLESAPAVPPVSADEVKAARMSPRLVQSLRKRLGLSQMALARLVGVSAPAVAHWEAGEATPAGQNRAALVGLRRVGKREVKELLARQLKKNPAPRKPQKTRSRKRRRRRAKAKK